MKPINWKELECLAAEWQGLIGAQVQRADQPHEHKVYLSLYGQGASTLLMICVDDDASRAHLARSRPGNPPSPFGFVGLLRSRIVPSRLESVHQTPQDRVVRLGFVTRQEDVFQHFSLVAELTGRHANLFLLDDSDTVLASLRPNRSEDRDNTPGKPYQPVTTPEHPPKAQVRFSLNDDESPTNPLRLNQRAEKVFNQEEEDFRIALEEQRIQRWLSTQRKKHQRTQAKLLAKKADWEKAPLYQKCGDLLQSHFHKLARGQESIDVDDWFEGGLCTITLLPELTPQQNVERYYRRYKKALRGKEEVENRLLATEDELDRLDRLSELLEEAKDVETLHHVARKAGIPERKQEQSKRKNQNELRALPYRLFVSSSGKAIWVGKGAKDNDRVSFGLSKGHDLWLHAHEAAGSHVVVRLGKREKADDQTLREAAQLALHYSKAHGEGEVMISEPRFLRKPKHAPAGLVYVTQFKVLTLRKDDATIRRLMADSRKIWDGEPTNQETNGVKRSS